MDTAQNTEPDLIGGLQLVQQLFGTVMSGGQCRRMLLVMKRIIGEALPTLPSLVDQMLFLY